MENYYRNLYQIGLRDRYEIKKELDLYKSLVDMQQDITNEKNKRIENLEHDIEVLKNMLEEKREKCEKEEN